MKHKGRSLTAEEQAKLDRLKAQGDQLLKLGDAAGHNTAEGKRLLRACRAKRLEAHHYEYNITKVWRWLPQNKPR